MRFAELTLERYGRFEDCRLAFREGAPDLHVIYGLNEAGKSTTLAAVSDLLFGFGPRTPYNFRFDYNLLRIGAVIEADGVRRALRRRKGQAGSLVDGADRPVDEGPLLAMLKGQSRETFRLAFSLDHARLREGGRAIVDARDDLGRAVFAAGSGMTGVSAALAALENEADAIWGPRAAQRRTYTAAKAAHDEATKRLKAQEIRPKSWTDARKALDEQAATLATLETRRRAVSAEQRRVERLRRISAAARRREELLVEIAARSATKAIAAQAEAAAETALAAAADGERKRAAADVLLGEAEARAAKLDVDDAVLSMASRIEAAVTQSGAERKAAQDLIRLQEEARALRARMAELEAELRLSGAAVTDLASRAGVERLRALADGFALGAARLRELEQSLIDAEARAAPLRKRLEETELDGSLPGLTAAVEAARALGADMDATVETLARAAERALTGAETALTPLTPWSGTAAALAGGPRVEDAEIEAAQAAQARYAEARETGTAAVMRIGEELAQLLLEREALTGAGQAVSAEAVALARAEREARWAPVRAHLRDGARLPDPQEASASFEKAVAEADAVADRRFSLAEASGRLAAIDARRAALELGLAQARERGERAAAALAEVRATWTQRLQAAGLPTLDPLPLRAWFSARSDALAKAAVADAKQEELREARHRRAEVRARLVALLAPAPMIDGEALAPVLERAEARRREGEGRAAAHRADRTALHAAEDEIAALRRRLEAARVAQASTTAAWDRERAALGLDLQIEAAGRSLTLLDDLRALRDAGSDLIRRIEGIRRDAAAFAADVAALADALSVAPGAPLRRLEALQARLTAARAAAEARRQLRTTADVRRDERDRAAAARDAALAALAPTMALAGLSDPMELPEAIAASRELRALRDSLAQSERAVSEAGDGYPVSDLIEAWRGQDPDQLAGASETLATELDALNDRITDAGVRLGEARRAFEALEGGPRAADALADAQLARAEMDAQAEAYLLKRAEAVVLRWAIERYRERRQNPLLTRAATLFSILTLGRYVELRVDVEAASPRLLCVAADRAAVVDVPAMSEGTIDQLFLALRIAAVEQSIAAGVRLPFLADDLFVNFDDARARAGFRVLAELARSTQVLFFTHHAHLGPIARDVVGADVLSECELGGATLSPIDGADRPSAAVARS